MSSGLYVSFSVKKAVNTVVDRQFARAGSSIDIEGLPVIPDIESPKDLFYSGNSYFGIVGALSKIFIDSMLEFSEQSGIVPDMDIGIPPQLRAVQAFRSVFNTTILLIQVFLCFLATVFTLYCVYRSGIRVYKAM
ncbi:MAG: hypothetical protein LBF78_11200 [Treponema sp.]|nr:hypothetical protein [Treponema sp.]